MLSQGSDVPAAPERPEASSCGLRNRKASSKAKAALPKTACAEHKSLATNRYGDTLAAFGCICKAMIARGLQSCCTARPTPPTSNKLCASSRTPSRQSRTKSRVSVDSCADSCCRAASVKAPSHVSVDSCCKDSCCDNERGSTTSRAERRSCAGGASCCARASACAGSVGNVVVERRSRMSVDSCGGSCCAQSVREEEKDPEVLVHAPSEALKHAVLAVKGMTCVGCENKLNRALRAQSVITNIKTSFVLSRAEFDYSGGVGDLKTLIAEIERFTGFTVTQIESGSSATSLDFVIDPKLHGTVLVADRPHGVRSAIKVDKTTIRFVYQTS